MSGDPYRKTAPGERLKIPARAWNRLIETVGESKYLGGEGFTLSHLPSVRIQLQFIGYFGQVIAIGAGVNQTATLLPSPTFPANIGSLSNFSAKEKQLPTVSWLRSGPSGVREDSPIAICNTNNDDSWVVSGFAITRVRVFNHNHRYASFQLVNTGRTEDGNQFGSLTSAFWGPVRLIGYYSSQLPDEPAAPGAANDNLSFLAQNTLTYPNSEYRWALVQL